MGTDGSDNSCARSQHEFLESMEFRQNRSIARVALVLGHDLEIKRPVPWRAMRQGSMKTLGDDTLILERQIKRWKRKVGKAGGV